MIRRNWDKQRVIEGIQACYRTSGDVSQIRFLDGQLYSAAKRKFGTWRQALQAAGIPAPRQRWSREAVISSIKTWHDRGVAVTDIAKRDHALVQAGARCFGRWTDALLAAGLQPEPPFKWTKPLVIQAIRKNYRSGMAMKDSTREERSLARGALRCFGSWANAMLAAGLKPCRKSWSKERIIEELRARYPTSKNIWSDDPGLAAAAKSYFGNRRNALLAAGFTPPKPRETTKWSRQRILQEIKAWHRRGMPAGNGKERIYSAARRHFGSWNEALSTAGVPIRLRRWNKHLVIEAIQDMHRRGIPFPTVHRENRKLLHAARTHFGSWREALTCAGFPMARPKRSSSWNADKVIMAIRDWRERGLPLNKVWKQNKPLHRAATRYFGGWHAALTAAEFETQSRRKWSKELVLEELRSYHLPSGRRVRHYDPRLVAVAIRYFGSLRNALSEAGLESYRKWNKRLIVEAIQDRYIRGLQVHSLWDTDRPLASAGKSHFGSWKAALTAAGLASEYREPKPTKKWSKQLVIEAIQAHHRDGLPMTKVWKEDANLYSMGKKYFGSWRNAMAAAGLPMQRRTWSKQIVIDEIQTRLQEGRSLCGRNRENKALTSSAIHYFGSWRKAVQVARRTKQAKPR